MHGGGTYFNIGYRPAGRAVSREIRGRRDVRPSPACRCSGRPQARARATPPAYRPVEAGTPGADRRIDGLHDALREGGARIYIFGATVAAMQPPGCFGTLLGHVMVHEITHGLQGVSLLLLRA